MEGLLFGGASVIVGSKFTIFALFYFVFEDSFPSTIPRGLIFLEGLIHGRAYFRNFTVLETHIFSTCFGLSCLQKQVICIQTEKCVDDVWPFSD